MAAGGASASRLRILTKTWLTREHLACVPIQMASGDSIKRGQQDAHSERLVAAAGRALRPVQIHPCARRRMMARAQMPLQ